MLVPRFSDIFSFVLNFLFTFSVYSNINNIYRKIENLL